MKTQVSFVDQTKELDKLAKYLQPTGSGPIGYKEFFTAVEALFRKNEWNYTEYVKWATDNYYARCAREKKMGPPAANSTISE